MSDTIYNVIQQFKEAYIEGTTGQSYPLIRLSAEAPYIVFINTMPMSERLFRQLVTEMQARQIFITSNLIQYFDAYEKYYGHKYDKPYEILGGFKTGYVKIDGLEMHINNIVVMTTNLKEMTFKRSENLLLIKSIIETDKSYDMRVSVVTHDATVKQQHYETAGLLQFGTPSGSIIIDRDTEHSLLELLKHRETLENARSCER